MLAAALLTASDPQILLAALSADELIAEILDKHEARYWHHFNEQLGAGLHPDDQRRLVAVAALLGAGTEADAGRLVRLVPGSPTPATNASAPSPAGWPDSTDPAASTPARRSRPSNRTCSPRSWSPAR